MLFHIKQIWNRHINLTLSTMCKKARAVREDSPCLLYTVEISVLCVLLVPLGVHEVVLCDFDVDFACLGRVYHLDELCRSTAP